MFWRLLAPVLLALSYPAIGWSAESASVKLPDSSLTAGIPGTGKLTTAQIDKWLSDPANHAPLTVELPLGLDVGASAISIPKDNPITKAKIELGRQLFFDTRLSSDNSVSCASCHDPNFGYGKNTQFGVGINGQQGGRNSPIALNRILSGPQFWDGRAESLEAQAIGPIANPIEMGNTHEKAVATVKGIDGYKRQFDKIFPKEGVTIATIGKAIATFERVIVSGSSPADYYEPLRAFEKAYEEDIKDPASFKADEPEEFAKWEALKKASAEHPINESAKRGRELFFSQKANCTACHVGANFTDEKFHNIGVGMQHEKPDLGRHDQTKDKADHGAFKTPTIRNITQTGPYMHDGSQKTLEEVVDYYDKGGHPNVGLSDKIKQLKLTAQDKKDLVEFMKALTGDLPKVNSERLP